MDGCQGGAKALVRLEEVVDVGLGVVSAGVAVTTFEDGGEVRLVAGVRQIEAPVGGVDRGVTRHAGGGDAVEGVHTVFDTDKDIIGLRDAQQVAGLVLGQFLGAPADDCA